MTTKKETATAAAYDAARAYYERTAEAEAAWTHAYDAAKAAGSRQIKTDANAAINRLATEIHTAGPAAHTAIAQAAYTAAREAYEANPTETTKYAEAIANNRLDRAYREQAEAELDAADEADDSATLQQRLLDARDGLRNATSIPEANDARAELDAASAAYNADWLARIAAQEARAEQEERLKAEIDAYNAAEEAAYQRAWGTETVGPTPSADEPDGPDTTANPNDYATTRHTYDVWLSPIGSQIRVHADSDDEAEEIAFEHAAEKGWDYDPERDADDVTIRQITPRPAGPDDDDDDDEPETVGPTPSAATRPAPPAAAAYALAIAARDDSTATYGPESPEADWANQILRDARQAYTDATAPAPPAYRPYGGENDHTAIRRACAAYEAGDQDGADPYTPDEEAYNDAIEAAIDAGLDPSRADALAVAITAYAQTRNTGSTIPDATRSAIEAYHETPDDDPDWTAEEAATAIADAATDAYHRAIQAGATRSKACDAATAAATRAGLDYDDARETAEIINAAHPRPEGTRTAPSADPARHADTGAPYGPPAEWDDYDDARDPDANSPEEERTWRVYRAAAHAEQAARDYGHIPADIGYPVFTAAINAGAHRHEAATIAAYAEARACYYPGHRTTAADAAEAAYTNCRQANHTHATAHALAQLAATQNGSSPHAAPYHADQAASDYAANAYNAGQARPEGTRVCAPTPSAAPEPTVHDIARQARLAAYAADRAYDDARHARDAAHAAYNRAQRDQDAAEQAAETDAHHAINRRMIEAYADHPDTGLSAYDTARAAGHGPNDALSAAQDALAAHRAAAHAEQAARAQARLYYNPGAHGTAGHNDDCPICAAARDYPRLEGNRADEASYEANPDRRPQTPEEASPSPEARDAYRLARDAGHTPEEAGRQAIAALTAERTPSAAIEAAYQRTQAAKANETATQRLTAGRYDRAATDARQAATAQRRAAEAAEQTTRDAYRSHTA